MNKMDLVPIDVILSSGEANGDSVVNLDAPNFIMDELRDVVGVTVLQASIPFSYYVFDNLTNQFKITVTAGTSPAQSTYTCTITPGSYNSINLIPQLTNAFATARNSSNTVDNTLMTVLPIQSACLSASSVLLGSRRTNGGRS